MPVYKTKTEKTKDKKMWYFKCNYKDVDGNIKQKKSKKFATKEEATKEEAKFLLSIGENNAKRKITIYDVYNTYFFVDNNNINKESSLYTKEYRVRKYIMPFFFNTKNKTYELIDNIDIDKIKKWKLWLNEQELSLITKKSIYNTFSSLFTYSVEKLNLKYNPLKLVGNFKERNDKVNNEEKIKYMTKEEYNEFINIIDSEEDKIIFHFLYEIGCRKGEMQALNWSDINFEKSVVKINKTLSTKNISGSVKITNTKNKKIRYIDISSKLKKELETYYDKIKKVDGFTNDWYIFGGIKYLSSTTLDRKRRKYYNLLRENNIIVNEITIHQFRHSSASYMISNNIPIEIIAYRLGDSPETIRKVYAHLFPDTQNEVKGLFEKL